MCNFRVGQKVVCIDDKTWLVPSGTVSDIPSGLVLGAVYTVSQMETRPHNMQKVFPSSLALKLQGFAPHPDWHNFSGWLCADRFRPVAERKTDISIFKAMLKPSKQEVRV